MKFPPEYDLYNHNKYLKDLFDLADALNWLTATEANIFNAARENLSLLKKANAIIVHLELVNDEVLKLEEAK